MADLINALREEMRRQAKKEQRASLTALRRMVSQHRRDIAELKRQLAASQKRLSFLENQERKRLEDRAADGAGAEAARYSPKSVRSHRRRLGLSAEDYGKLVGVSAQTIYHWERGKSRPRKSQREALVVVRSLGKREAKDRLKLLSAEMPNELE